MPTPLKTPQLHFALGNVGPLPWLTGTHPYYESLVSRPDVLTAHSLRSQDDIDSLKTSGASNPTATTIPILYDPVMDAAQFVIDLDGSLTGHPAISPGGAKRIDLGYYKGQSLFITWDFRFDNNWKWLADGYIQRHKTFWVHTASQGWHIWKTDYRKAAADGPADAVAELYLTNSVHEQWTVPGESYQVGETLFPRLAQFHIRPDRWTRIWEFIDGPIGGGIGGQVVHISAWVADPVQGIIHLYDRLPMYSDDRGLKWMTLSYDSSATPPSLNPPAYSWDRNVVVLTDLTLAQATALVATTGL